MSVTESQIRRSVALRMLERMHPGKSAGEIIREACSRHDTPEGAAADLGVSVTTLRKWRQMFAVTETTAGAAAR